MSKFNKQTNKVKNKIKKCINKILKFLVFYKFIKIKYLLKKQYHYGK